MPSKTNEYAYEESTIDHVAVADTDTLVLAGNPNRRSAVLVNVGGADVYLAIGRTAEPGKGIYLKAGGGAYEINATNLTHAPIHAITATGEGALCLHEGV